MTGQRSLKLVDSLEFIGGPTNQDLKQGEEFGARFAESIRDE